MGLLAQERAVDSKSYLFDGSGGMRDQLEQAILNELEKKSNVLLLIVAVILELL